MDRVGPRMYNVGWGADCPTVGEVFEVHMGQPIITNREFVTLLCKNL